MTDAAVLLLSQRVQERLGAVGLNLQRAWVQSVLQRVQAQQLAPDAAAATVLQVALHTDLRACALGALDERALAAVHGERPSVLARRLVLQVDELADVLSALETRVNEGRTGGGGARTLYKLRLTDGVHTLAAFNDAPVPVPVLAMLVPGAKIAVLSPVCSRGLLQLRFGENCTVLGGGVDALAHAVAAERQRLKRRTESLLGDDEVALRQLEQHEHDDDAESDDDEELDADLLFAAGVVPPAAAAAAARVVPPLPAPRVPAAPPVQPDTAAPAAGGALGAAGVRPGGLLRGAGARQLAEASAGATVRSDDAVPPPMVALPVPRAAEPSVSERAKRARSMRVQELASVREDDALAEVCGFVRDVEPVGSGGQLCGVLADDESCVPVHIAPSLCKPQVGHPPAGGVESAGTFAQWAANATASVSRLGGIVQVRRRAGGNLEVVGCRDADDVDVRIEIDDEDEDEDGGGGDDDNDGGGGDGAVRTVGRRRRAVDVSSDDEVRVIR